jgi:hypothetical protein
MAVLVRRFLVVAALMFWQGGFTFYAAVVVPIGQATFGPEDQGAVTRQVTNYLNLAGGIGLIVLAWDVVAATDTAPRRWTRGLAWAGMALALAVLVGLHLHLDQLLDQPTPNLHRQAFRFGHRVYLWVSTFQWACGLLYLASTLRSWMCGDGRG